MKHLKQFREVTQFYRSLALAQLKTNPRSHAVRMDLQSRVAVADMLLKELDKHKDEAEDQ